MPFPIAYIAGSFPARSETFVYREVRELRRRGWEVRTISLNDPKERGLAEFADLVESYRIVRGTNGSGGQEAAGRRFYDPDGSLAHRYGLATEGLVLIRPDGYIGFRSRALAGEHLRRYLQDLFLTVPRISLSRK